MVSIHLLQHRFKSGYETKNALHQIPRNERSIAQTDAEIRNLESQLQTWFERVRQSNVISVDRRVNGVPTYPGDKSKRINKRKHTTTKHTKRKHKLNRKTMKRKAHRKK